MTRCPLLLLTGFLGSGKTTILNHLVASDAFRDTAVIINEAGLIGLDHLLVEEGADSVVILEGGCLCCRMQGGLSAAVAALFRRRLETGDLPFSRIIVETSGLADPTPILQSLMSDAQLSRRVSLAGVVTVVDAQAVAATLEHHPQVLMQIALADRLLLTKTDLVPPEAVARLRNDLSHLNESAPQILVTQGKIAPEDVWTEALGLLDLAGRLRMVCAAEADGDIATASLAFPGAMSEKALDDWLDHTLELFGPLLLRMKAMLQVETVAQPVILHAVQGLLHAPEVLAAWPGQPLNRVVLIGRDLDERLLSDALARLAEAATSERPAVALI